MVSNIHLFKGVDRHSCNKQVESISFECVCPRHALNQSDFLELDRYYWNKQAESYFGAALP